MATRLVPLGDQGWLAYFPQEAAALRFAEAVRQLSSPWLTDVVPAYTSVGVFFDPEQIRSADAARELQAALDQPAAGGSDVGKLHHIPCCYELGPDLARVAEHTGLAQDGVIRLHTATQYIIYAIGFSPGFPYLGYLPEPLCGVPRLPSPRLRVEPGSVGLTGRQTGIYPEAKPGGWNLIGRTPLELVHVADGYFPLRAGDRVIFDRIDDVEFRKLEGKRLPDR